MNGPNVLCQVCGAVANHVSLLCEDHRNPGSYNYEPTRGDRLYMAWRALRDADAPLRVDSE